MSVSENTVVDVFNQAVKEYRTHRAFTCLGKSLTFEDIDILSAKFASYLQKNTKLVPGDRIAIQLPNVLQYPVALFGSIRAGLVVVNTNPLYTPREIKHQLSDSGAKALVVFANVAASAAEVIKDTNVENVVITEIGDLHSPFKRLLLNTVVKHIRKGVPDFVFPSKCKQHSFHQVISSSEPNYKTVVRSPSDVCVLQYTGGTTGVAKGAMLTNANLVANKDQVVDHLSGLIRHNEDTYVAPLPLYHIYAFTLHCMALLSSGNHSLLIPNPRDLKAFVNAMKKETIYGFAGLNTLFNALCQNEEFKKLDFSHMESTSSGGMALTSDTSKLWQEITGVTPNEGYGLTETSPVVSSSRQGEIQSGTVGTPVKGTELKVVNDNGETLEAGEVGELWVRGPQVMKGYWLRPEETAKVLDSDGWFKTGDMAIIQKDGYLKIVDRKKDMILVSGFNVYPNEIEDILSEYEGIMEAGVIGIPDEHSGEVVKAFIVPKNENVTKDDVLTFCKKNMAGYKVPKSIEFVSDLPKSAVGKILRKDLKKLDL
ncbi:MAG: AMP-binding protein [Cellvibrionaceae bacterium]